MFPIAQIAEQNRYIPRKTLDVALEQHYKQSERGIVVARAQHLAILALSSTFQYLANGENDEDLASFARLASVTGFGAAYHLFTERYKGEVMNKMVCLPVLYEEENGNVLNPQQARDHLLEIARSGLCEAGNSAEGIREHPARSAKQQEQLGRLLANVSLAFAAIAEQIWNDNPESAETAQINVWVAGELMKQHVLRITDRTGAIPTVAQLADSNSPLRRDLVDDPGEIINRDVYTIFNNEITRQQQI